MDYREILTVLGFDIEEMTIGEYEVAKKIVDQSRITNIIEGSTQTYLIIPLSKLYEV